MNIWAGLVLAGAALPALVWFWARQLRAAWRFKAETEAEARASGRFRDREAAEAAGLGLLRDVILAAITLGAAFIAVVYLAQRVDTYNLGAGDMQELIERVVIGAIAAIVIYGLSAAVLPRIYPDEGTRRSRLLSETTGILIAGFVGLSVATQESIYRSLRDSIVDKASGAVGLFVTILFAGIGVYLAWKRITVMARPLSRPGSGGVRKPKADND